MLMSPDPGSKSTAEILRMAWPVSIMAAAVVIREGNKGEGGTVMLLRTLSCARWLSGRSASCHIGLV
jgi:hypothetical protein